MIDDILNMGVTGFPGIFEWKRVLSLKKKFRDKISIMHIKKIKFSHDKKSLSHRLKFVNENRKVANPSQQTIEASAYFKSDLIDFLIGAFHMLNTCFQQLAILCNETLPANRSPWRRNVPRSVIRATVEN